MKIAILGSDAGANFIAQRLQEEGNTVYLHLPTDKNKLKSNLDFLTTVDAELVVTTTLSFQFWPALQTVCQERNIPYITPSSKVGMLEWSKIAGKKLLNTLDIPTPDSQIMPAQELVDNFFNIPRPYVIKFDQDWRAGLQTVIVTNENVDTEYANLLAYGLKRYMTDFGEFKEQYVTIEQYIEGREYSWHAVVNSTGYRYIGSARDYKKRYENDLGHNTTDMGSYSPVPNVDPIIEQYADKIFNYFKSQGIDYRGFLYLGIMVSDGVPYVLEINTRPGDSEIQSILPTINNNLADLLYAVATDQSLPEIESSGKSAVSLRLVNRDYRLDLSVDMMGPELVSDSIYVQPIKNSKLFHSVLTAVDNSVEQAADQIYKLLSGVDTGDYTYRTDIGYFK